jgi:hypothetical protein
MKPFNLQAALNGAPVVTRGGFDVQEIVRFKTPGMDYPISAVIKKGDSIACHWHTDDGCFYHGGKINSDYDLFMKVVKKTVYYNIYIDHAPYRHETKEAAIKYAEKHNVIAIAFPVEMEV